MSSSNSKSKSTPNKSQTQQQLPSKAEPQEDHAQSAVRYVPGSSNGRKNKSDTSSSSPKGTFYLRCHIKPGASKDREGVAGVTDEVVELCVSAQAREGEANKAVVRVLSEILKVPKSELQITHGLKSRDKTVALSTRLQDKGSGEEFMGVLKERLQGDMDG